jgi:hypothetical protein
VAFEGIASPASLETHGSSRAVILKELHVTSIYNTIRGLVVDPIGMGFRGITNKYPFLSFRFELGYSDTFDENVALTSEDLEVRH